MEMPRLLVTQTTVSDCYMILEDSVRCCKQKGKQFAAILQPESQSLPADLSANWPFRISRMLIIDYFLFLIQNPSSSSFLPPISACLRLNISTLRQSNIALHSALSSRLARAWLFVLSYSMPIVVWVQSNRDSHFVATSRCGRARLND